MPKLRNKHVTEISLRASLIEHKVYVSLRGLCQGFHLFYHHTGADKDS